MSPLNVPRKPGTGRRRTAPGTAQRLMMEGLTTCAGFPVVEDGNMRSAITRLEKAAQTLREGLARVVDQQEGESQ